MSYVDFHCHLDHMDSAAARNALIASCAQEDIGCVVTVGNAYEEVSLGVTRELVAAHAMVKCTVGAHPHKASQYTSAVEEAILAVAGEAPLLAVGEAGLDFHYTFSPPEDQRRVFRRQIALARELAKPLVIHAREAEWDILRILDEERFEGPVVFHCYTGDAEAADAILARGAYLSISGIVTFKKATYLHEIVRGIPLDRLFTETDSPYLSPEPYRGKENSPLRVPLVARRIAELKGIPVDELNRHVHANLARLAGTGGVGDVGGAG